MGLTDDPTPSAELLIAGITEEIHQLRGIRIVPVRRLRSAAGSEILDLNEQVKSYPSFRQESLSRHGLVADRCSIINVTGESTGPTVPEVCMILVTQDRKRRLQTHIFVVRSSDGLVVKRARNDYSGEWLLVGDHPVRELDKRSWPAEPFTQNARKDCEAGHQRYRFLSVLPVGTVEPITRFFNRRSTYTSAMRGQEHHEESEAEHQENRLVLEQP